MSETLFHSRMPHSPFIENYQLLEHDCVPGMAQLAEKSVDVIVTSPPYNLGVDYGKYKDRLSTDAYLQWTQTWIEAALRVLKDKGSFFLNLGACPSNPLLPFQVVVEVAKRLRLQNTFHWIKSISVETRKGETISVGHFKPINSDRFVTDCHEYVFHFTRNGDVKLDRLSIGVPYQDKSNIGRWGHTNGKDRRCRGNTWFIPYETINRRAAERPHPATFPVQLARNCILLHGACRTSAVLDPFVGLGSSAIAAYECSARSFVGFEIEHEYLLHARERLKVRASTTSPLELCLVEGGVAEGQTAEPHNGKRSNKAELLGRVV
jgi:site-specific DNA-methyltransferase (adenine-specific)